MCVRTSCESPEGVIPRRISSLGVESVSSLGEQACSNQAYIIVSKGRKSCQLKLCAKSHSLCVCVWMG